MKPITDTGELAGLCERLRREPYVTIDTEFMRERTYWPRLCLVQLAGADEAAAIDTMAEGLDLAPLYGLLDDPDVLKVFHAARQDLEIFYHLTGHVPAPLFDTQVAGMVCGFGDSVAYETLARKLSGVTIDKSSRFTDWSRRPLSDRQLEYALSDVIHLRPAYEKLRDRLAKSGREDWLEAEMRILSAPATYRLDPEDAWRRIKLRTRKPRMVAILQEVAAWREREAQTRDMPRGHVLRDEALAEIASRAPQTTADLAHTRGLPRGMAEGRAGRGLLEAVARGLAVPERDLPRPEARVELPKGLGPVIDLLKVLLKTRCDEQDVAQRLIATTGELEQIAADDEAGVRALGGWRREIFGEEALALKHGRIGLAIGGGRVRVIEVGETPGDDQPGDD